MQLFVNFEHFKQSGSNANCVPNKVQSSHNKIGGVLEQGNPGADEEGRRAHKEKRAR